MSAQDSVDNASSALKTAKSQSKDCQLIELMQYDCTRPDQNGKTVCFPLPHIFRICPNQPATELTAFTEVDSETGALTVSPEYRDIIPKTKPWRDVMRERDARH
ncbi:hypothetical protein DL93DRAFT_2134979 [Clavulina sp. PMI_390]|nr:hypothetical protein DL93DRAFT_2134979 [Clavulina sp. PMI_390]